MAMPCMTTQVTGPPLEAIMTCIFQTAAVRASLPTAILATLTSCQVVTRPLQHWQGVIRFSVTITRFSTKRQPELKILTGILDVEFSIKRNKISR